jgi:predicted histidine transporter YuiF (NhaC family)
MSPKKVVKKVKKLAEKKIEIEKSKRGKGALFIPAGLFLGFGIGFAFNNIPAGMFVGLGVGFAAFAVSLFFEE